MESQNEKKKLPSNLYWGRPISGRVTLVPKYRTTTGFPSRLSSEDYANNSIHPTNRFSTSLGQQDSMLLAEQSRKAHLCMYSHYKGISNEMQDQDSARFSSFRLERRWQVEFQHLFNSQRSIHPATPHQAHNKTLMNLQASYKQTSSHCECIITFVLCCENFLGMHHDAWWVQKRTVKRREADYKSSPWFTKLHLSKRMTVCGGSPPLDTFLPLNFSAKE